MTTDSMLMTPDMPREPHTSTITVEQVSGPTIGTSNNSSVLCVPDQDLNLSTSVISEFSLNEDLKFYEDSQEVTALKNDSRKPELKVQINQSAHQTSTLTTEVSISSADSSNATKMSQQQDFTLNSLPVVFLPRTKQLKPHRRQKRRRM